jgi:gas vesicle protein
MNFCLAIKKTAAPIKIVLTKTQWHYICYYPNKQWFSSIKKIVMNYKKLISGRSLSMPSNRTTDTSGAIVALLTGLAVGAVLGVLFAPSSGKKTREQISDKALGLTDNMKDGLVALREQLSAQKDNIVGLKDRLVDKVKGKASAVTQEFKDFKNAESEKTESYANGLNNDTNPPREI